MRPRFGSYIPYYSSKLIFMAVVTLFGCIITVELLINFYKIAEYQRGAVQYEMVPYDL